MLENILNSLGLPGDEAKAYLLLLETGSIPVGNLAKKLGVPRSSLYGFLKRLVDQGLVIESIKGGIKRFSAEPPDKINQLFKERIEQLSVGQEQYQKLLPELRAKQPSKLISPKLQLFEGAEGLGNVLKDMLLYYDMETQAFWPQKKMVDILTPDFFRYHNKERIKNNLSVRAIWPEQQIVDIKKHPYFGTGEEFKRNIRIAPKDVDFTMGYWIYGNKVAFISSRKESFGFIIESSEFAHMLLSQFNLLWNLSTELSTDPKDGEPFISAIRQTLPNLN
jgi:HTH-type transcriptional regulator, sugar sensing transcriptional regulator